MVDATWLSGNTHECDGGQNPSSYHVPHGYMTEQASQMLTVQGVWLHRPCLRRIIRNASVANEQLLFMTGKGTGNSIKFDPS